jgi:hypothetical protein
MRSKWALLAVGGLLGSVAGLVGATISDPEVGFPAWVDLTGVLAGFTLGVLVAGLFAAARASRRSAQERRVR